VYSWISQPVSMYIDSLTSVVLR